MREIKFRAFIDGKPRYDVTGLEHGDKNEMAIVFVDGDPHKVGGNCILSQATGYKSEIGDDVYEHDIVMFRYRSTSLEHHTGKVVFDEGMWIIESQGTYYSMNRCHHFEVIGNIFENAKSYQ